MNAFCLVLAGSPSTLIFLSPSHDWPAKEDPICSGGETVPSPGTAGSSLPVHGSFCCWGATFEIFCSQWCRECTDGRTPTQLSSSLSFSHTSTNFKFHPQPVFLFLENIPLPWMIQLLAGSWVTAAVGRQGWLFGHFLCLMSFG